MADQVKAFKLGHFQTKQAFLGQKQVLETDWLSQLQQRSSYKDRRCNLLAREQCHHLAKSVKGNTLYLDIQ
jgi:hypothetical protein